MSCYGQISTKTGAATYNLLNKLQKLNFVKFRLLDVLAVSTLQAILRIQYSFYMQCCSVKYTYDTNDILMVFFHTTFRAQNQVLALGAGKFSSNISIPSVSHNSDFKTGEAITTVSTPKDSTNPKPITYCASVMFVCPAPPSQVSRS